MNFDKVHGLDSNSEGINVITGNPVEISDELYETIQSLRDVDIIRKSHTLHCKGDKINKNTIYILLREYTDDELVSLLPIIPNHISTQFYTVSYLKRLLTKAVENVNI